MRVDGKENADLATVRKSVKAFLGTSEQSYHTLSQKAQNLLTVVREEIANTISVGFNETVSKLPQGDYEERKKVAHWVNNELRLFGLGVRHPTHNHASVIYANPTHGGRFHFAYRDDSGIRHAPGGPATLGHLELTLMDPVLDPRTSKGMRERI